MVLVLIRSFRTTRKQGCPAKPLRGAAVFKSKLHGLEQYDCTALFSDALTSALYTKRGSFELADGGTFFLDEIGDMRLDMQAKILRVLEEKKVKKLGSEEEIFVDVRVIAATNKELGAEIKSGRFREDLYYGLNIIQIAIPPLRAHKGDIPILARNFLKLFSAEMKKPVGELSDEAVSLMLAYDWPGNVRELKKRRGKGGSIHQTRGINSSQPFSASPSRTDKSTPHIYVQGL